MYSVVHVSAVSLLPSDWSSCLETACSIGERVGNLESLYITRCPTHDVLFAAPAAKFDFGDKSVVVLCILYLHPSGVSESKCRRKNMMVIVDHTRYCCTSSGLVCLWCFALCVC